jgi:hypothetical protein
MEPVDLARELRVDPKKLRSWLRKTFPRGPVDHGAPWNLTATQSEAARAHFKPGDRPAAGAPAPVRTGGRDASDEAYVLDLCDEVLEERGYRQHRFDWLLGDQGRTGGRVALPVDGYYPEHRLVVEYRERQHDEPVKHFDKPDKMTVSGVHRGEQRRLYDQRREELIPANGLRLVVLRPSDLASTGNGRLRREHTSDLAAVRRILGA